MMNIDNLIIFSDDKLISFDSSPSEDVDQGVVPKPAEGDTDLLGASLDQDSSPGFGDFTETKDSNEGMDFNQV